MSWNIGENRNLFLQLKSKLGLYHVVPTTPETSPKKVLYILLKCNSCLKLKKVDSKNEASCLKCTLYNGRRKICRTFKTDMNKLDVVVYRYRNNTYVKDTEMDLKSTEFEKILSIRVYLLSYMDVFFKRSIVVDETTVNI